MSDASKKRTMMANLTRRNLIHGAGNLAFTAALSPVLAACGGSSNTQTLSTADQLALTASQAVQAIREGRLSAKSYVQTLLDQASRQAALNSLISLDVSGALSAASRIDALLSTGVQLPPLAGLPIIVKDNINTSNLPTTGGTPALKNFQPKAHAPSLQKLVDAGAIILGKANLHELAFGATSTNFTSFAGFVRNPYDRSRIPGGSSGGTAAAIAARIAPAGLGTDTGGSTRVPAALCGIVGFRPSVGNGGADRRYSDSGSVVPISHTRDTVGPMGRTVADIVLLDSIITGTPAIENLSLKGLRLGIPSPLWNNIDNSVSAVMSKVRNALANAGVTLVNVDMTGLMEINNQISFQIALHEPTIDIPAYLSANGLNGLSLASIASQVASPDVQGAFTAILADIYASAYPDAVKRYRPQLQALYDSTLKTQQLDALIFPTTPIPAVPIDGIKGSSTVNINGSAPVDEFGTLIRNTDPGSNAGIPGLSLYAGMTASGLPVGVELDGAIGSDRRLMAIGLAIENLLGTAPPPVFQ